MKQKNDSIVRELRKEREKTPVRQKHVLDENIIRVVMKVNRIIWFVPTTYIIRTVSGIFAFFFTNKTSF